MAIDLQNPPPVAAPAEQRQHRRRRIPVQVSQQLLESLILHLQTGSALHSAIEQVAKTNTHPALKNALRRMANDIASGSSFSAAALRQPDLFSTNEVRLLEAGELGAFLPDALQQIITLRLRGQEVRRQFTNALAYPLVLVVIGLAMTVFMLVEILPSVVEMLDNSGVAPPRSTQILMAISEFLLQYWLGLLAGGLGLSGVVSQALSTPQGRQRFDRWRLDIPWVGSLYRQYIAVQCLRTWWASMDSGLSIIESISTCRGVVDNTLMEAMLDDVVNEIHAGSSLAKALSRHDIFPAQAVSMLATGEETSNIPLVLRRLVEHYDQQLQHNLQRFSALIEPILLLIMGSMVLSIVASLLLPIFTLSVNAGGA